MTRRAGIWLAVAVVFTVANLGGAGMAAAAGELIHAGVHVALTIGGAYVVWWIAAGRAARRKRDQMAGIPASSGVFGDRLTNLEQSVDAVALEVERIGEGQRYMTRIFSRSSAPQPTAEDASGRAGEKAGDRAEPDPPRPSPDSRHD